MGYVDTAKGLTKRVTATAQTAEGRQPTTDTHCVRSVKSVQSPEALPLLGAGPGSAALRRRVLQLGEEHAYPALSLGRYRFRKRNLGAGLFAGRGWWQHQTAYFGDSLLAEAVRQLDVARVVRGN